jgi:hypothetical protein
MPRYLISMQSDTDDLLTFIRTASTYLVCEPSVYR